MGTVIGKSTAGVVSTWAWLRSPLGNNQIGYGGGTHNIEFASPGFMTAENTFFRCDEAPLFGTTGYPRVTTSVGGQQYMWFRFGPQSSRVLVIEDEETITGQSAVLDNDSQTITITADAFEGPGGYGQELDPDSEDILEVYDFLPY